ncbi:MAG: hypothetical protein K0Q85_94, partial [Caproiciproducens sp.]|nr:hypothetical protein [Caproiciproducens sp.]
MNFIKTPNLPQSDVALIAISGTYPKIIDALNTLGIETIEIEPCRNLSEPVSGHADMLCHHLGKNQIIIAVQREGYLKAKLESYGFDVISSNKCISKLYPYDVPLNAARVGNYLIANQAALDNTIMNYCKENGVEIIHVKQGYTKCSTIVVDEHSIITADQSIERAAIAARIDTLLIEPGHITLPKYNYGFIGGACGFIGKNKIAFTGNINSHPSYGKM